MVQIVRAMAAKAPDDVKVLTLLCSAYHKAGDYPSCIYAADHALAVDPGLKTPMIIARLRPSFLMKKPRDANTKISPS